MSLGQDTINQFNSYISGGDYANPFTYNGKTIFYDHDKNVFRYQVGNMQFQYNYDQQQNDGSGSDTYTSLNSEDFISEENIGNSGGSLGGSDTNPEASPNRPPLNSGGERTYAIPQKRSGGFGSLLMGAAMGAVLTLPLGFYHVQKTKEFKSQISSLNDQISSLNGQISDLNGEISGLNGQIGNYEDSTRQAIRIFYTGQDQNIPRHCGHGDSYSQELCSTSLIDSVQKSDSSNISWLIGNNLTFPNRRDNPLVRYCGGEVNQDYTGLDINGGVCRLANAVPQRGGYVRIISNPDVDQNSDDGDN